MTTVIVQLSDLHIPAEAYEAWRRNEFTPEIRISER